MGEHWTSQGSPFVVDDEDDHIVEAWSWNMDRNGYVRRRDRKTGKTVRLHNSILEPEPGYTVDHINRKKWDNRRSNLRLATTSQQAWNKSRSGAYYQPKTGKWAARITTNGVRKGLGFSFNTREEAEEAYQKAFEERLNL